MHPAIIIGTVRSLWTWLWGRYHVPLNAFLVEHRTVKLLLQLKTTVRIPANGEVIGGRQSVCAMTGSFSCRQRASAAAHL